MLQPSESTIIEAFLINHLKDRMVERLEVAEQAYIQLRRAPVKSCAVLHPYRINVARLIADYARCVGDRRRAQRDSLCQRAGDFLIDVVKADVAAVRDAVRQAQPHIAMEAQ